MSCTTLSPSIASRSAASVPAFVSSVQRTKMGRSVSRRSHRRAENAHRTARLGQKGRQIALLDSQGEGSKGGCFSYGFDYGVHKYREYTFIVSFARKKPPQNVGRSEPLSHGCAVPTPRFGEPSPLSEFFLASPIEGRWVLPQGFRGLLFDYQALSKSHQPWSSSPSSSGSSPSTTGTSRYSPAR